MTSSYTANLKISKVFHGSGGLLYLEGRVGSDQEVFEVSRVGGRVGSKGFRNSRVGSDRVRRFLNLTGRVGSGRVTLTSGSTRFVYLSEKGPDPCKAVTFSSSPKSDVTTLNDDSGRVRSFDVSEISGLFASYDLT